MFNLKNFPTQKQSTPFSCGYSTIASVYSYLEKPISEKEVLNKSKFKLINYISGKFLNTVETRGIPPLYFVALFNKISRKYKIKLYHAKNEQSIIDIIARQMNKNLPVPFLYSVTNDLGKNKNVIHYSTIIGFENKDSLIISDPFGYIRKLDVKIFLNKLSFSDYERMPFIVKLLLALKIIRKNTIFILE